MSQFTVNPSRFDPYKQFKFRIKWDGRYVAGVDRVSPLKRSTEVVSHREGADPSLQRRSPGQTAFEPIVISRGRTHDTEFEHWANKVWQLGAAPGGEVSLRDFRKDIIIEILNEAGQVALAFIVRRCWPAEYTAISELDAGGSSVLIESLTLEHEGWERDPSVPDPFDPALGAPSA